MVFYNRKGARCSIGVGCLGFFCADVGVSEASDDFLANFVEGGKGVLVPLDEVRVLNKIIVKNQ